MPMIRWCKRREGNSFMEKGFFFAGVQRCAWQNPSGSAPPRTERAPLLTEVFLPAKKKNS